MLTMHSTVDAEGSFPFVFESLYHTSFRSKGSFAGNQKGLLASLCPYRPSFAIEDLPSSSVNIA